MRIPFCLGLVFRLGLVFHLGLVVLLLLSATPPAACSEPIHPDDRALIDILVQAQRATTEASLRKAAATKAEERRAVGPDAHWMRFRRGGESVTLWIDALVHRSKVAGLRLRSLGGSEAWKAAAAKALGSATKVRPDGIDHRSEHEAVLEAYRKATHALFSKPPGTPWGGFTDAVRTLLDPLADLTYGTTCYEAGEAPAGRAEADKLRLQGRVGAFETILKGPNPEGRLYAAQALLLMTAEGAPVAADHRPSIEIVRRMQVKVRTCSGCCVEDRSPSEVMADAEFLPAAACHIVDRSRVDGAWVEERRILVYWDGTYVARHRLVAPLPTDTPALLRGTLGESVLDALYAHLSKRQAGDDESAPTFTADDTSGDLPAAIEGVRRAVPKTR